MRCAPANLYSATHAVLHFVDAADATVTFATTDAGLEVSAIDDYAAAVSTVPVLNSRWVSTVPVLNSRWVKFSLTVEEVLTVREALYPLRDVDSHMVGVGPSHFLIGGENYRFEANIDRYLVPTFTSRPTAPVDTLLISELMWRRLRRVTDTRGVGMPVEFSQTDTGLVRAAYGDWLSVYFRPGERI